MKKPKKKNKKSIKKSSPKRVVEKKPHIYIPGFDSEITLIGPEYQPPQQENTERLQVIDKRGIEAQFGPEEEDRIRIYKKNILGRWSRLRTQACVTDNVLFSPPQKHLFKDNIPIRAVTKRLVFSRRVAEKCYMGTLELEEPAMHFPGKTAFIEGTSSQNYFHYIVENISDIENLYETIIRENIERIVVNPCNAKPNSFHHQIVNLVYPEIADRFVFINNKAFTADKLYYIAPYFKSLKRSEDGPELIRGSNNPGGYYAHHNAGLFFDRAEKQLGTTPKEKQTEIIMISREKARYRKVINEDEVMAKLGPLGVRKVIMEDLTVEQQAHLMARTKLVFGPHGAGMINAGFLQSGATCIELSIRNYLPRARDFAQLAMLRDINYHFMVCDEYGDTVRMKGDYANDIIVSDAGIDYLAECVEAAKNS